MPLAPLLALAAPAPALPPGAVPAPWPAPLASARPLVDPLLEAFGVDRFQTPQTERAHDPHAAGRFGPTHWSFVPPLTSPLPAPPLAALAGLLADGLRPGPRLSLASWTPPPPARSCRPRPATIVRFGGESEIFSLTDCDGAIRHEGLERLSVLARPPLVERPAWPLPDAPTAAGGEWVPGIRLLPPRLALVVQRVVEAFPHRPVYLISGYRPGSGHGFHTHAHAVDLFVMGVPNEKVYKLCRKLHDVGCGFYPNNKFVHLDIRPPGAPRAYWIDTSAPGEPSHYVDAWPGVEEGGAAVGQGGGE